MTVWNYSLKDSKSFTPIIWIERPVSIWTGYNVNTELYNGVFLHNCRMLLPYKLVKILAELDMLGLQAIDRIASVTACINVH
jgi:hypothetical protein